MPELPEVETVRRGLENWCRNAKILDIQALHPRATNERTTAPIETLRGARINNISRRGKFLWFELDRDEALVAHLGMSGQFRIQSKGVADQKHLRASFLLQSVAPARKRFELHFVDQRTFGWLAVSPLINAAPNLVSHIALDIFDPLF